MLVPISAIATKKSPKGLKPALGEISSRKTAEHITAITDRSHSRILFKIPPNYLPPPMRPISPPSLGSVYPTLLEIAVGNGHSWWRCPHSKAAVVRVCTGGVMHWSTDTSRLLGSKEWLCSLRGCFRIYGDTDVNWIQLKITKLPLLRLGGRDDLAGGVIWGLAEVRGVEL